MNFNSINFIKFNQNKEKNLQNNGFCRYENLRPLKADTVSFGSMKKNEFKGIDFFVVNKFRAPIEKFNNNEDLQKWCGEKIEEIKEKDLEGRQKETTKQRKETFKQWLEYVLEENDAYTNSIALFILDGALKDVKLNNDVEIPPLNKGVLASVIDNISKKLEKNPKENINFNKEYRLGLQNMSFDNLETHLDTDKTGWVIVPSKEHDPKNFEDNVDKVKTLSYRTWCTASFNAKPYLEKGDFHVYLEKGKPKLGVRFVGDEMAEIQGELNNSKIPIRYLNIAKEHAKDYKQAAKTQLEFVIADQTERKIEQFKNKLAEKGIDIRTCSAGELLTELGIKNTSDENGLLTISHFKQPCHEYTFEDMGVNENVLFKQIKAIEGDADFNESSLTDLGNLQYIGGNADFNDSKISKLKNLKTIGGNTRFANSRIVDLGALETVGSVDFGESKVSDLKNLKTIKGDAKFENSKVVSLGGLESIDGDAHFENSNVEDLGELKYIGGRAIFDRSKVKSLNKLKEIKGRAFFENSELEDLGDLENIGESANFYNNNITSLGKLKYIGDWASFMHSNVEDLGELKHIGGSADFRFSKIKDLKNLKRIDGDADFMGTEIESLGKLKNINGNVYIRKCNLTQDDFENVEIGGRIIE